PNMARALSGPLSKLTQIASVALLIVHPSSPLSFHCLKKALVYTVKKPRIRDIEDLIHNAVDCLGEFHGFWMLGRPLPRMNVVSRVPQLMNEARDCCPSSPRKDCRGEPRGLGGNVYQIEVLELQGLVSLGAELLPVVRGCSLHFPGVQEAHRLQRSFQGRTLHDAGSQVRPASRAFLRLAVVRQS